MGINAHSFPIGRFAPSPTGELHLGSLTTAVASYCHIKSLSNYDIQLSKASAPNLPTLSNASKLSSHSKEKLTGKWLLRIEDTDIQRCKPEFSERILHDLTNLGLHWDGEVVYQSKRTHLYNDYINDILESVIYACDCSRKSLKGQHIYPRHCVHKGLDSNEHKLRIQLPNHRIGFYDGVCGIQWQNPQTSLGDMVIRRDRNSLNMMNYILAVAIDDGLQEVTHVMRGLDILPMTSAQIAIMKMVELPMIDYWYHLPLVINEQGQKLSKQNLATPIDTSSERKSSELLATALTFLQQPNVDMDTPERMLIQAVEQWDTNTLRN